MTWAILNADARHVPLKDQSVQCIVTSPPYWGLRDYNLKPSVWGGDSSCKHVEVVDERIYREMRRGVNLANSSTSTRGGAKKIATVPKQVFKHSFCVHCDAWFGCLGLEPDPDLYIEHIVSVFREAWRVLKKDGTLWVNMGDSYTDSGRGKDTGSTLDGSRHSQEESRKVRVRESAVSGLRPKNLVGMPWRVAFALQADGWTLRRDIIWHKTNPMPESCEDRPTTAHEYIFLFAKTRFYYYDGKAIAEPVSGDTHARYARGRSRKHKYADGGPGDQTIAKGFDHMVGTGVGWGRKSELDPNDDRDGRGRQKRHGQNSRMEVPRDPSHADRPTGWHGSPNYHGANPFFPLGDKLATAPANVRASKGNAFGRGAGWRDAVKDLVDSRNSRSVWSMATQAYSGAHFATFPEALAEKCILAGSRKGDVVLDIFSGAGTTVLTADKLDRVGIGTELGPDYCKQSYERVFNDAPLLNHGGAA